MRAVVVQPDRAAPVRTIVGRAPAAPRRTARLRLTAAAGQVVRALLVAHLGACTGTPGAPVDCGFDPQLAHDPRGDLVQLASYDGAACVKLRRAPVALGDDFLCKACPYDVEALVVGVEAVVHVVDDPDRVYYEPSHHNWDDRAWANLDDGATVAVRMTYGTPWTYSLSRFTDDAVDEIALAPFAPLQP
jgi:hypothetical protein